jgi:hypothetical protein
MVSYVEKKTGNADGKSSFGKAGPREGRAGEIREGRRIPSSRGAVGKGVPAIARRQEHATGLMVRLHGQ